MSGRIDAARQATDNGIAAASQACSQPFSLRESILRCVSCADNGHGNAIGRLYFAADEQHSWWIWNVSNRRWIVCIRLGNDCDAVVPAIAQRGIQTEFLPRRHDATAELLTNSRNRPQFTCGGIDHGSRRTEMIEQ